MSNDFAAKILLEKVGLNTPSLAEQAWIYGNIGTILGLNIVPTDQQADVIMYDPFAVNIARAGSARQIPGLQSSIANIHF